MGYSLIENSLLLWSDLTNLRSLKTSDPRRSSHVNVLIVGVIDNSHQYWYYAQHEIR